MDPRRFDQLSRELGTRRTVLGRLLAGTVASLFGLAATPDAEAVRKGGCPKGKKKCRGKCIPKRHCCTNAQCRSGGSGKLCRRGACKCPRGTRTCGDGCVSAGGCCTSADCPSGGDCQSGVCTTGCTPDCGGKQCGGDGCGGSCGACSGGMSCVDGACQVGCTPNCAGRNCGGDGCGGSCGTCGGGATCVGGTCRPICTPSCAGKNCGGDGCGGSCGTCAGGLVCSNPANGGICQCPTVSCNGSCCANGQQCFGTACWPDSEEVAFVTLINNHRAANGRAALTLQNQLGLAAELHSQDQATGNFSSHTGSDGSTPDVRITRAGYDYSWWGENIYFGGAAATDAFAWWLASPGHNANMLSTNFTQLGIARARSAAGVWYWTTTFGQPG